jgi:hypothetical protein
MMQLSNFVFFCKWRFCPLGWHACVSTTANSTDCGRVILFRFLL